MNIEGDFRYVSPKEFREFGNFFKGQKEYDTNYPFGYKQRLNAFKPGGILATKLANSRYSVVQVGSWLFVHGGISPECAEKYSIYDINIIIKKWLLGDTSSEIQKHVHQLYHTDDDDHSPFGQEYDDVTDGRTNKFNKKFKNYNILNVKIRNNDNVIKGMKRDVASIYV